MLLLHLSDLHLSRYGESGSWSERKIEDDELWKPLQIWNRWRVEGCSDRKERPLKLRLVDPEGVVHKVKRWSPKTEEKIVSQMLARAMKRYQTSTERLMQNRPDPQELEEMLRMDPKNTNLRFLKIVEDVRKLHPDVILISGDLTDKGFGYELLLHYFGPWIEAKHLFVVPGNHDVYEMMPRLGRMARAAAKVRRYLEFAERVGLAPNQSGAYVRRLGDVAVVGINSCGASKMPLTAGGAVTREQLAWLGELGRDAAFAGARLRIGLVHHHFLRMPFAVGKRMPFEVGMRLRNAVEVLEICEEAHMDILFNGHRHHGYAVQLPGRPLVISAPSSTLGCKSTGQTYAWLIDLDDPHPRPKLHPLNGKP
jgi:3',5'-cyclic-AMP phosphodiesterase